MSEKIIAHYHYPEESFLKADGFDSAVIGVDTASNRLIYSVDSVEHFEFNVWGYYMGEKTPIWCEDMF